MYVLIADDIDVGYKSDMGPKILFVVPPSVADIAAIRADCGGAIEFESPETEDKAANLLAALVGNLATIEFPLPVDPMDLPFDGVEAIAKILDREGGRYIYVVDAFEEPSRGLRVRGRVVFNDETGPHRYDIAWEHGEPKLDALTLCAGGMDPNAAAALIARWQAEA